MRGNSPSGESMVNVHRLLELGLSSDPEPELCAGTRFGDYEISEILGQGGMGIVYRARHIGIHRTVALKVIRSGALASDVDVLRFRAEAAANLDHPHIVPVYHFGECHGQPFFTMPLFESGTLAQELERALPSQRRAAELIASIARAVQHAHQCGVLHRDLKPSNILLDERGQPHVADFGIARRMDEGSAEGMSNGGTGHPDYMAPEQLSGSARGPTVAADIYGLGVVLYQLLTGELPRRSGPDRSVPAPSSLARVTPELELICLRCLQLEPGLRYGSAGALADDLERCLRGELPRVVPPRALARLWWRVRRYPVLAVFLAGAAFVSLLSLVIAIWVGQWQAQRVRAEILKVNRYAAQAIAGQVLFQLRELAERLAACADDPAIARRIQAGLLRGDEPAETQPMLRRCGAGSMFDGVRLFAANGFSLTRFPLGKQPSGLSFLFRDYYRGAHRLGELQRHAVYVGRAIRSESDDQIKLPLAAPVFAGAELVGVVLATIGTDSTLASLELPKDDRRIAALIGLRDRDRIESVAPDQYMLLVHPQLVHGQAATVDSPALSELERQAQTAHDRALDQFVLGGSERVIVSDPHRDPLLPGNWLAGIAAVGNTSYAVIVQTPQEATESAIFAAVRQLVALSGTLLALGTGGVLVVARAVMARRRSALG